MGKTKKGAASVTSKKGKSKHDAAAASKRTSCTHLHKGVDAAKFEGRTLDMDACQMCSKSDVDLVVCLTCALVACKAHAKKHWAAAKSYHCIFMEGSGSTTCWECDIPLSDAERLAPFLLAVTGDAPKLAPQAAVSAQDKPARAKPKRDAAAAVMASSSASDVGTGGAIRGLNNLGNSCYFNSVVQVMATLFGTASQAGGGKLHRALEETLHAIRSPQAARTFSPRALFDLVRAVAPQFRGGQQQDAHELFLALVDALQTEKSDYAASFQLATTSFVTCHSCKTTHLRRESAYDVSVELVADGGGGGSGAVQQPAVPVEKPVFSLAAPLRLLPADVPCLMDADVPRLGSGLSKRALPDFVLTEAGTFDCRKALVASKAWPLLTHFTAPELLHGADKYSCAKCQRPRVASKQILLSSLPRVLPVHLKRFKQTASGKLVKITSPVALPPALDVAAFCVPNVQGSTSYALSAVVVHEGGESLRSGHYIALVRSPQDKWYEVSDTRVQSIASEAEALRCKAFVAFYRQRVAAAVAE